MKYYAGIGSRDTPREILELMEKIGSKLAMDGYTLRTGGADGADSAFERGARAVNGAATIYIPWKGFNGIQDGLVVGNPEILDQAYQIAASQHPNWQACSNGAKKLHTRNVFQVLGHDYDDPMSEFVVCWTKNGSGRGGTGQAIRIARSYGIAVYDLGHEPLRKKVMARYG